MASSLPSPWLSLFLSLLTILSLSSAQQNIQTFFPSISSPAFSNQPPLPPPPSTAITPPSSHSNHADIAVAIVATAVSTLLLSGIVFFAFYRYTIKSSKGSSGSGPQPGRVNPDLALKGVIVDENGLDVLYWRNLTYASGPAKVCQHCNGVSNRPGVKEFDTSNQDESIETLDSKIHEKPLLPLNSVSSSAPNSVSSSAPDKIYYQTSGSSVASLTAAALPTAGRSAPPPAPEPAPAPPPPPPPPAAVKKPSPSPPPPPPPRKTGPPPPPPKPPLAGRSPPPMGGGGAARPPPVPAAAESGKDPTKMKPLHWDKMNLPKDEHSMVWDKITNGSFRVDDDLMEALFGYVATNRKSPTSSSSSASPNPFTDPPRSPTQITILDSRKSQNIAIVVRTLAVSRSDILDALLDGRGLSSDTLEKLSRIAPSKDEQSQILAFSGVPSRLADGDSFLFHLLRAVPSPFGRIDSMLFRSNFDNEVRNVSESLRTLELACGELRNHGLFLKLLEAVLKAGNRMNAGTARGNAQAFNLTTLCKLSDVKSTDGKTTLLHFVVEEVVRSEGKRCLINRNHSLRRGISRNDSITSTSGGGGRRGGGGDSSADVARREEREKEYKMLGLPVVGGLSTEFGNVKRAASVDYDTLVSACGSLVARVTEIRKFLDNCPSSSSGNDVFVKEMSGFLDTAAAQVESLTGEQTKVLELVVKTTEYYQAKDRGAQPLQLFVIVRDFLVMVDKTCIDLTRNLQTKNKPAALGASETPAAGSGRGRLTPARFPNLPPHFMSDGTKSSSDSDSDDGF